MFHWQTDENRESSCVFLDKYHQSYEIDRGKRFKAAPSNFLTRLRCMITSWKLPLKIQTWHFYKVTSKYLRLNYPTLQCRLHSNSDIFWWTRTRAEKIVFYYDIILLHAPGCLESNNKSVFWLVLTLYTSTAWNILVLFCLSCSIFSEINII